MLTGIWEPAAGSDGKHLRHLDIFCTGQQRAIQQIVAQKGNSISRQN